MPERSETRAQSFLLPPSLDEWVAPEHPVRFVDAFVAALPEPTRSALGLTADPHALGAPRYAPALLARVWVYGFVSGIRSARALERACRDQLPLRWLTGNQTPDHNTLWRWYAAHRLGMHAVFVASVRTAVGAGLVDLALVAVDGTKVAADAAADRSLTADELAALLAKTEQAIAALEAQNEPGDDPPPPSLPPELRTAQALRARVETALAQVEARAAATGRAAAVRTPRANVTDPEARWMKTRRGIVPGYNAQLAVAATNARAQTLLGRAAPAGRIVLAAQVSTQPADTALLVPLLAQLVATLGTTPRVTVADAGYFDGAALAGAADLGATVVVSEQSAEAMTNPYHRAAFVHDPATDRVRCPEGHELVPTGTGTNRAGVATRRYGGLAAVCPACPAFGTCTTNARAGRIVTLSAYDAAIQAQRRTREWAAHTIARRRRKTLVEGVVGTLKTVLGGGRTRVRGLAKVDAEWRGLALGLNLRTLGRVWAALPVERRDEVLPLPSTG